MTLFLLVFAILTYLAIAALIGRCWPSHLMPRRAWHGIACCLLWPLFIGALLHDACQHLVHTAWCREQARDAIRRSLDASR
jgi:hypothetical protein